jgi:phage-related protein
MLLISSVSLNPIGLVVIAVAALAAGFVLAYKKVEPFRDLLKTLLTKLERWAKQ